MISCQPDGAQVSAPLGNAQTETVLMVMVRSIAKEGSIKCRLKLISVLLELKVNNSLGYLRSDNQFNLSVFRDLVNSLCREPSYSMTSSLFSPLALPRGIRTANNDGAVPKELVSILDQHKLEAAEVLEVPILIALLGLDQTELNAVMNIGSKLGTIMTNNTDPLWKKLQDGMIHQQLWQPVCKKMANLSPRLRYLSAFGDADKSILTVLGTGSAQLDVLSVKNTGAFPLYKAILKTMLISRCKTMYGQNPYGRNFCSPEDATILDILVRMCRDDKQGKETVLSTNEVLIILDSRGAYGGFLSSGHNMSSAAIEAMTAVPDLLNKFTSYLCSSIPAIALKRAECLIGLWRSMLQHAKGNSNNVVEALVSTLPSLAVGITSVTMSAANRQKLDILLNSFISMLGPYKVQYRDMISREVANASKIIKSKPKVVAEFRRVESSLIA
ncbi:hypothetical protein EON65_03965 [archaeon]|nr:MAG: hypothetical protein EON65_03965 [archaeon]